MTRGARLTLGFMMVIAIVVLALYFSLSATLAQSANPKSQIENLYRGIEQSELPLGSKARNRILSSSLRRLITHQQNLAQRSGEIGVDWDFIINGQDIDQFQFISAQNVFIDGKRAEVEVEFRNGQNNRARIDMILEGAKWKIYNIRYQGEGGYDLRNILNENIKRFRTAY